MKAVSNAGAPGGGCAVALVGVLICIVLGRAAAAAKIEQRPVFVSGRDGYHTYRIPAIVVTKKGTLLAFCEGRKTSRRDHGDIDLVLKRSFDGGRTWQPMQLVHEEGGTAKITIGNPAPVVDRSTGTIWLPFCRDNDRVFVTSSTDDGATWSVPREITNDVKRKGWTWYATGPVHGIQLRSGRLLIPCDHRTRNQGKVSFSHVIYSDDHGATWKLGGVAGRGRNECTAVETMDGSVYLNMRGQRDGGHRRGSAWSRDGGVTWSEVKLDETLIEPVCQGSACRLTDAERHDKNRVLFCNPAGKKRERMTVRVSYDECRTWSEGKVLHGGPCAYSDLCVLPDMTICCLYERGKVTPYETITAAVFDLAWLTDGADQIKDK